MPFTFDNPNTFANNPLDRQSEKRADSGWIAKTYADPTTLVVPFWKLKPFTMQTPQGPTVGFMKPGLCDKMMGEGAPLIFLGRDKGGAYFAADISAARDPEAEGPLAGLGVFKDLRALALEVPPADAAILGQARSLIDWHQTHRFCAACGVTLPREGASTAATAPVERAPAPQPVDGAASDSSSRARSRACPTVLSWTPNAAW